MGNARRYSTPPPAGPSDTLGLTIPPHLYIFADEVIE